MTELLEECFMFTACCFVKNNETILEINSINYKNLPKWKYLFFVTITNFPIIYQDRTKNYKFYVGDYSNNIIRALYNNCIYTFYLVSPPLSFLEFDKEYEEYIHSTINPLTETLNNYKI